MSLEATLFRNDFREIVISSAVGRFVNGGRSRQDGLELAGRIDTGPLTGSDHNLWLQSAWTFVPTARFRTTSDAAFSAGDGGVIGAPCEDDDGCFNGNGIIAGTRLPYAPRHTLSLTAGYRHPAGIEARFGLDYRSSQEPDPFARVLDTTPNASGCSDARCSGLAGTIPAVTLFNAGLSYTPREGHVTFFGSAWNLFGKEYLASWVDGRTPAHYSRRDAHAFLKTPSRPLHPIAGSPRITTIIVAITPAGAMNGPALPPQPEPMAVAQSSKCLAHRRALIGVLANSFGTRLRQHLSEADDQSD